ncbi:MAG: ABC transporter substrate-binding protein [Burkholderiaceae bacterium]
MRRAVFLAALAAGLLAASGLLAQTAEKVFKIGYLAPSSELSAIDRTNLDTMRASLRHLGWVEGRNLQIETRHAGSDPQRQRALAAELKALGVALILAPGTTTIRAAHEGAPGLPVVMVNAGDPVGSRFVASLSRPGGDLTGTSAAGEEVLGKQVELLRAAVPHLKRIVVLMNSANPANDFFFRAMAVRAAAIGVPLDRVNVAAAGELDAAIERARGGGLVVLGDPMFVTNRVRIVELVRRFQVPAIYGNGRVYVDAGGLMTYLSPESWHYHSAAGFVDRILKGAKPADLPVEQPTQFELIINLKTAKALGITIPQSVLLRADEVIQ